MTGDVADPRVVGDRILDGKEILRRVVPSAKSKAGVPANGAFFPSPDRRQESLAEPAIEAFMPGGPKSRDNGGLSTHREWKSPREAYLDFVTPDRPAIGTWGVMVSECEGQNLPTYDDGGIGERPKSHATVWFPDVSDQSRTKGRRVYERIGLELCSAALSRECLYRPDSEAL
jgi:hypothetical protein